MNDNFFCLLQSFKVFPLQNFVSEEVCKKPCKIKCTYNSRLGSIFEYHSKGLKPPGWGILVSPRLKDSRS